MRTSTRQDWIAAAALLAALAAAFMLPAATSGASFARAVAVMALGALVALAVGRTPFNFALRVRSGIVLLVLLSLWYVITRLWAVNPAGSMSVGARLCAFVLVAWAVHTCVQGVAARRALLIGVGLVAGGASFSPLVDALRHGAPDVRIHGLLDYWNATAIVAIMLVPCAVALAGSSRRRWIVLAAMLIPMAGVAAAATASRGALLALLVALTVQALLDPDYRGGLPRALIASVSLAIGVAALSIEGVSLVIALASPAFVAGGGFALVRARRSRRDSYTLQLIEGDADNRRGTAKTVGQHQLRYPRIIRAVGALLVLGLIVILALLVVDSSLNPERDDTLKAPNTTLTSQDSGNVQRLTSTDDSERLTWYREALDMWRDRPVIGQGGDAFDALRADLPGMYVQHVHSMPIEVLLEAGIIGMAILSAAVILLLRVLRQGRRSTERALAGSICALILTQSLVDWTLSIPQIALVLAICGPIALVDPVDNSGDESTSAPMWEGLTMLTALAAASTIAFMPVLASLIADQAAHQIDAQNPQRAVSLTSESMRLVPALDTLTLQVIALQMMGDDAGVRDALNAHERVWLHRVDGLRLAAPYFANDKKRTKDIERRIARRETQKQ